MQTFRGKYNSANVMIDELDQETISQIYSFLNHPAFAKTYIAIMPDTHAGAGAVIGFTAKMNDYIIPNVIGVDIGCGVNAYPLDNTTIDFEALDKFIKKNIPSGFSIRSEVGMDDAVYQHLPKGFAAKVRETAGKTGQDIDRALCSFGTLGGGNHFIEIDKTDDGQFWLVIHSGSRNFGLRVATYHQNKAKELIKQMFMGADAYKGLEYLPMDLGGKEYLDDMKIAQEYATHNRAIMAKHLIDGFFKSEWHIPVISIHNYINFEDKIIRKGAVSAHGNERLIIPFNMRDGVLICRGRDNKKWNYSAPHGAGRILSRRQAKDTIKLEDFQSAMEGIYTTTATKATIDESPMAYKDKDVIVKAIAETVDIEFFMKPVYNFKAGGE